MARRLLGRGGALMPFVAAADRATGDARRRPRERLVRRLGEPHHVARQLRRARRRRSRAHRASEVVQLGAERLVGVELGETGCRPSGRRGGTRRTSRDPCRRRRWSKTRTGSGVAVVVDDHLLAARRRPCGAACSARASSARRWPRRPTGTSSVRKATSGIPATIESRPTARDRRRASRRASRAGSRSRAARGPRSTLTSRWCRPRFTRLEEMKKTSPSSPRSSSSLTARTGGL